MYELIFPVAWYTSLFTDFLWRKRQRGGEEGQAGSVGMHWKHLCQSLIVCWWRQMLLMLSCLTPHLVCCTWASGVIDLWNAHKDVIAMAINVCSPWLCTVIAPGNSILFLIFFTVCQVQVLLSQLPWRIKWPGRLWWSHGTGLQKKCTGNTRLHTVPLPKEINVHV